MKKYIYYLISLMLIFGCFYIPKTYARANAMVRLPFIKKTTA